MNERIKELAEQADLYARSDNSSMLFENYQKRYTEKFAELIVRECIECSDWVGEVNKNPVEPIHTAHAINKRIKQHFGVEE